MDENPVLNAMAGQTVHETRHGRWIMRADGEVQELKKDVNPINLEFEDLDGFLQYINEGPVLACPVFIRTEDQGIRLVLDTNSGAYENNDISCMLPWTLGFKICLYNKGVQGVSAPRQEWVDLCKTALYGCFPSGWLDNESTQHWIGDIVQGFDCVHEIMCELKHNMNDDIVTIYGKDVPEAIRDLKKALKKHIEERLDATNMPVYVQ